MRRLLFATTSAIGIESARVWSNTRQSDVPDGDDTTPEQASTEQQMSCGQARKVMDRFWTPPVAHCEALTDVTSDSIEPPRKRRKYWVEPKCGVPFPENLQTLAKDHKTGKNVEVSLPFIGGGIRCMLGNGALCDVHPHTRVYAFGLYVEPTESEEQASLEFRDAIFKTDKYKGTRTLRIVAVIPKDGIHWARGFFKSCIRYGNTREIKKDAVRKRKLEKGILKFCELFADLGTVPPGADFHFTWNERGLLATLDGHVLGEIKNEDAIRAVFKIFFNHHDPSGIPGVNPKVAHDVQLQWQAFGHYEKCRHQGEARCPYMMFPQEKVENGLFNPAKQPEHDPCMLRGYQATLGATDGNASGSFDGVRGKLWRGRGQKCADVNLNVVDHTNQSNTGIETLGRTKEIQYDHNEYVGKWEFYDDRTDEPPTSY